jgi:predicted enzyme related to lactoylglutathione lyase
MKQAATATTNKPVWVDLATKDPAAARDYYGKLFGWQVDVNPDPQYGGYGRAQVDGQDVAGIGSTQSPEQPTTWSLYIGTDDAEALARKVEAAGGMVAGAPFDVGDQGRMAIFRDPTGSFISVWQTTRMGGFQTQDRNAFAWAELNARSVDDAIPFYTQVFGWATRRSEIPEAPDYTEFLVGDESIAGAWEMNTNVPAGAPNFWLVYFGVDDVDAAARKAVELGGRQLNEPQDFPGGRFAIVNDPQGATFGLMQTEPR